jgi:hypothetical protein
VDKRAFDAALVEFGRAHASIDELQTSNTVPDVQRHWAAFLVAAGRVFTKLERGSKSSRESIAWFGTIKEKRRTDPILSYIWNARNVDEHGIEEVTQFQSGSVKYVDPTPEESAAFRQKMQKIGKPYTALAHIEVVFPHVRLVEIVVREGRFQPPRQSTGDLMAPAAVALLALAFIENALEDAAGLVE